MGAEEAVRPCPGHGEAAPPILRVEPVLPPVAAPDRRTVVLDTTWTPRPDDPAAPRSIRDIAQALLVERDLIEEAADHLDGWAAASGVADALTVDGTSFWFYARLRHWMWLQGQILWLALFDAVLAEAPAACIEVGPGVDPAALEALRSISARDGLSMMVELGPPAPAVREAPPGLVERAMLLRATVAAAARSAVAMARRVARWGVRRARRVGRRLLAPTPWRRPERTAASRPRPASGGTRKRTHQEIEQERAQRLAAFTGRFETLAKEQGRLLVVLEHAEQRVEVDGQVRTMNAYLGPVADRLRGTALEPIELDIRARVKEDAGWGRFTSPDHPRLLTIDALGLAAAEMRDPVVDVDRVVDAIREAPVEVAGVDLGPELRRRVVATTRAVLANQLRSRDRIRWVLRRLRPAGILLADEYHRQDWMAAARGRRRPDRRASSTG